MKPSFKRRASLAVRETISGQTSASSSAASNDPCVPGREEFAPGIAVSPTERGSPVGDPSHHHDPRLPTQSPRTHPVAIPAVTAPRYADARLLVSPVLLLLLGPHHLTDHLAVVALVHTEVCQPDSVPPALYAARCAVLARRLRLITFLPPFVTGRTNYGRVSLTRSTVI